MTTDGRDADAIARRVLRRRADGAPSAGPIAWDVYPSDVDGPPYWDASGRVVLCPDGVYLAAVHGAAAGLAWREAERRHNPFAT